MKLTLNGEEKQVEAKTVAQLVEQLGLAGQPVAVEVNRAVIRKAEHARTELAEGDTVEVVTLVGGG